MEKTLTLSTFEAMFTGKTELFRGLKAEEWVKKHSEKPSPILKLDFKTLKSYYSVDKLNLSIIRKLEDIAHNTNISFKEEQVCYKLLGQIIHELYRKHGPVVILIDDYNKAIVDNLEILGRIYDCEYNFGGKEAQKLSEEIKEMLEVLNSLYTMIKSCNKYLRFVFITGIELSHSPVLNIEEILLDEKYSNDITCYTQQELENYFCDYINDVSQKSSISKEKLLTELKGYCSCSSYFGSKIPLYQPYWTLYFLKNGGYTPILFRKNKRIKKS